MDSKSVFSLLLLNIVWSSFYVANRFSLLQLSPLFVGVMVRLLALIFLLIFIFIKGYQKDLLTIKAVFPKLILIGILGFSLDITAFLGLQLSTASNAAILLKSDVLFTNVISILVFKQRFTKADWLLTFFILIGTVFVIDIDFSNFKLNGIGDLLFILSALFVALNGFIIKSVQTDKRVKVRDTTVAFYNNLITFIIFLLIFTIFERKIPIHTIEENSILMVSLIYTGIMQTAIYILYYYNLRILPVWIVRITLLIMPVFASLIGFFLLGETLKTIQIIGMIIVLLSTMGIILIQRRKKTKQVQSN
jgi:drug/metabolite transporter (DMT)-like permease